MPQLIDSWDSGLPGANWDSGLQWDVNIGPSPGDPSKYLALVTSEHNDKPKFMAALAVILQPLADITVVINSMPAVFDLDRAVGSQLDVIGLWVGVSRNVKVPLTNVYFSLDTAGLGFDQGAWWSPLNPISGLISLPDDAYRIVLRAKIANNDWDGSLSGAYAAWSAMFVGTGFDVLIQDERAMRIMLALTGPVPDALTQTIFTSGLLNLRPAGVTIEYMTPTLPNTPYFGFDVENSAISGFDVGAWGAVAQA